MGLQPMSRSISRFAALAAAALLALAVAPVQAADTTDGFSVNGSLSVTGIPATLSYGALDPGSVSGIQTVDARVTSNGAWTANISGTGFTGAATLPKSVRQLQLSAGPGITTDAPVSWRDFGDASLDDPEAEATGAAGSDLLVRSELRVNVPPTTPAGSYSGTISFTFTAS